MVINQIKNHLFVNHRRKKCSTVQKKFFIGFILGILMRIIFFDFKNICSFNILNDQSDSGHNYKLVVREEKNQSGGIFKKKQPSVHRPRYFSTELGVRNKLFIAIISRSMEHSKEYITAINKTLTQTEQNFAFFSMLTSNFPSDVQVHDLNEGNLVISALDAISELYLTKYDYIFIVKDNSYIRGSTIYGFVSEISSSHDVFVGQKLHNSQMCSLDTGIIFSNSVLKSMVEASEKFKNSQNNDDFFINELAKVGNGMECIDVTTKPNSKWKQIFSTYEKINQEFVTPFTEYPVQSEKDIYNFRIVDCYKELEIAKQKIGENQLNILGINEKLQDKDEMLNWPVGSNQFYKPNTRFDQILWQYFNISHLFFPDEVHVLKKLQGSDKLAINDAIDNAKEYLDEKYKDFLGFLKFSYGYRRIDLTRGIDYLLEFEYLNSKSGILIHPRVQVFKALSKMEFINAPYVTENSMVTIIIPVMQKDLKNLNEFNSNLVKLIKNNGKSIRTLFAFIHNDVNFNVFDAAKISLDNLLKKYAYSKTRIIHMDLIMPGVSHPSQIAVLDLVGSRLSENSLVFYCNLNVILKEDFLNRIKMNTIKQFQVFSPIPFAKYNPSLVPANDQKKNMKISKFSGHYDSLSYDYVSFYFSDYLEARQFILNELPLIKKQFEYDTYSEYFINNDMSIIEMFLRLKNIHIFRSVDKSLITLYENLNCELRNFEDRNRCLMRKALSYGSRKTLASFFLNEV